MWRKQRDETKALDQLHEREAALQSQLLKARADVDRLDADRLNLLDEGNPDRAAVKSVNAKLDQARAHARDIEDALQIARGKRDEAEQRLVEVRERDLRDQIVRQTDERLQKASEAYERLRTALAAFSAHFNELGWEGQLAAQLAGQLGETVGRAAYDAIEHVETLKQEIADGSRGLSNVRMIDQDGNPIEYRRMLATSAAPLSQ